MCLINIPRCIVVLMFVFYPFFAVFCLAFALDVASNSSATKKFLFSAPFWSIIVKTFKLFLFKWTLHEEFENLCGATL